MKKVLIGYISRTGKTQQMAEYIAEGVRMTGNVAEVKKITDIKSERIYRGMTAMCSALLRIIAQCRVSWKRFSFWHKKQGSPGRWGARLVPIPIAGMRQR